MSEEVHKQREKEEKKEIKKKRVLEIFIRVIMGCLLAISRLAHQKQIENKIEMRSTNQMKYQAEGGEEDDEGEEEANEKNKRDRKRYI